MYARLSRHWETLRHTGVVAAAILLVGVANLGSNIGAYHFLRPQLYSAFAALLAIYFVLSVPAMVLQTLIASVLGEASSDPRRVAALSHAALCVGVLVAAIIALAGLLLAVPLAGYLAITDTVAVRLSLLAISLGFAVAALRGILQGQQRFGTFAISLSCEAGGNLILIIGFILLVGGLRGAVLGNLCAIVLAFIVSVFVVWNPQSLAGMAVDARRLWTKFAGTAVGLTALAAMSFADVVLVRHFSPHQFAPPYGLLSIIGKMIVFSISFVPPVLVAKAAKRQGENRETRTLLLPLLAIGLGFCLIELAAIRIFGFTLRTAVGGEEALPYLFTYACAMAAVSMTTIVANYGIGTHRFAFVVPLALIELGEIVCINLFHATLTQVIGILVVGHCAGLIMTGVIVFLGGRAFGPARPRFRQDNPAGSA